MKQHPVARGTRLAHLSVVTLIDGAASKVNEGTETQRGEGLFRQEINAKLTEDPRMIPRLSDPADRPSLTERTPGQASLGISGFKT